MPPHRNLLPLAGFLICLASFFSYFFLFTLFPATRDFPWANWLLFAVGLALLGAGIRRAFRQLETYRGRVLGPILGILSLGVVAFFLFMTTVASRQIPASPDAPKVGQKAPDFTLPDSQGRPVALHEIVGPGKSWVVLIFYRGYW
jgi:hypothetical protein